MQEIRIGVFVCRCGINIAGVLDTTEETGLVKYANNLPNVVHAVENISYCTTSGAEVIRKAVEENNINRVVIAA
ncbi:MAG: hypothetical protein ACTSWY_10515 [Promethearchaeota archaeon]